MRAAAILMVVGLLTACGDEPTRSGTARLPEGQPGMPTPDQIVEDGRHILTADGVKKAVMQAEQLYFYNASGIVKGDTIQVSFYDPDGRFVSLLTALHGEMEENSQQMVARGHVHVRGTDATIDTEELHYDPARNLVWSDVPTTINQRGNIIRGKGVESDPALRDIRIKGGSAVLRSEPRLGRQPRPDSTATIDGRRPPPTGAMPGNPAPGNPVPANPTPTNPEPRPGPPDSAAAAEGDGGA